MQLEQGAGRPRTLYDKIWDRHRVMSRDDGQDLLFIDRHFIHDVTAQSFDLLRQRGLTPRSPSASSARRITTFPASQTTCPRWPTRSGAA